MLRRIGVDFTPLLPGGQNGGAGLIAKALLRELTALAPEIEFVVLAAEPSHAELTSFERPNVQLRCVLPASPEQPLTRVSRGAARGGLARLLPADKRARLKHAFWAARRRPARAEVARGLGLDLMFCPFTAPDYFHPSVPLVSIIYDLQHLHYPDFFGPEQRVYRQLHVLDACHRASRVVCVSDDARRDLQASVRVEPRKVCTIPLTVLQEMHPPEAGMARGLLERLGIAPNRYLLYPANFWPHKNHQALFEALRIHRERHPDSDLQLVCAGVPGPEMDAQVALARRLLPPQAVVFPGRIVGPALAALFARSRGLIFPSLYEGFGMPVLEAMAAGTPVLCADATSLPEVAGDAALLFDPHDPRAIAKAIERLECEPALAEDLVRRGHARRATFGTPRDMAARYLALFHELA
jgi:glycosyltransferase involved in cell wall biosynthesis